MIDLDELKSLGKDLPSHRPDDQTREALRASLLSAAEAAGRPRRAELPRRALVPVLVACAAGLLVWWSVSNREPKRIASSVQLRPSVGAELSRHTERGVDGRPFEVVRLESGRLQVATSKADEVVQIVVGDARVRGASGAFEVVANASRLEHVTVREGEVEVRVANQPAVILAAGAEWIPYEAVEQTTLALKSETGPGADTEPDDRRPRTEPDDREPRTDDREPRTDDREPRTDDREPRTENREPRTENRGPRTENREPRTDDREPKTEPDNRRPRPEPDHRQTETRSATRTSAAEIAFDAGYRALKRGDYREALRELALAIASPGHDSIALDARYWRAIALAKIDRRGEARAAMREFLQSHPQSARAGEMSVMLGWLLVDSGEPEEARALFQRALRDRRAEVVQSAQEGLRALDGNRR